MKDYFDFAEYENKIVNFCTAHNNIYLYGAGACGRMYLRFLQDRGIGIKGFMTTQGGESTFGIPVYKASDIVPDLDYHCGVILAIKEDFQQEVLNAIEFGCDVFRMSDLELFHVITLAYFHKKEPCLCDIGRMELCSQNILVVQLETTFGDMIWSTAFLRELRANCPDARIDMVLNKQFADLYKGCPYVDEFIMYDGNSLNEYISYELLDRIDGFVEEHLSGREYYAIFLPRLLPSSNRELWENVYIAYSCDARFKIAHALYFDEEQRHYCDLVDTVFSKIVRHTTARHEVLNDLSLIEAFGGKVADERMELWLCEKDREYADMLIEDYIGKRILIAVALVASVGARTWDIHKYGRVFKEITLAYGDKVMFILCGGTDSIKSAETVKEYIEDNCIDITGKTSLTQVAAVVSRADFYVGCNTGLLHIASVFKKPIIEISACIEDAPEYVGTSPTRVGSWKVPDIVLRPQKGLDDCKFVCSKPYAHCINQVQERQVYDAMKDMIDSIVQERRGLTY